MTVQDLNLHDALLERIELGPRRELRVNILIPEITSATILSRKQEVSVRFGAIENYEEVTRICTALQQEEANTGRLHTILGFRELRGGWLFEIEYAGSLEIRTAKPPRVEMGDWLT